MMKTTIIVSFLLVTSAASGPSAGGTTFVVDGKKIVRTDVSGKRTTIYETTKMIPLGSPSVSPNGRYVVFVETTPGVVDKGTYQEPPRNNMVVCDTGGTVLQSTGDDVRRLSWSPDGSRIAYITGTYREGGVGYRANGIFVLDVDRGTKIQISKDFPHESVSGCPGVGYNLNWATHDGNIYIQDADPCGGNYMYDTRSRTTQSVPYKGIHFSPDGKYYLAIIPEDDNYLYESATNRDITVEVKAAIGGMPYSWILDRDHHLYGGKTTYVSPPTSDAASEQQVVRAYTRGERKIKEKRVLIYDVDKRQIVEEWVEKP